jgi:hypothetical protein
MDNAVKAVLEQYDRRAARERAVMEKLTARTDHAAG